jgi:hydroxymethylglutaryl-CoA lyase
MTELVTITETARDAWQGLPHVIPTAQKVAFLQRLLDAGFPSLDIGSFVSKNRVPAMADSADLPGLLKIPPGATLTALVANERGLDTLLKTPGIGEALYPFSLSETFQQRNTNRSRTQAAQEVDKFTQLAHAAGRSMYVTISMAFGNNEGDNFDVSELVDWVGRFERVGVDRLGLADTTAQASVDTLHEVYAAISSGRDTSLAAVPGAHLHVTPENQEELLNAALDGGCRSFDSALGGLGGCQFAKGAESNVSTKGLVQQVISRGFAIALPPRAQHVLEALDDAARTLAEFGQS